MVKKVTIIFSLVEESNNKTKDVIIEEIAEVFFKENLIIPWCDKVEKISLTET